MDNDIKEYTTPKGEKRYKFLIYVGKDETTGHTIQIKKQGFKSKDEALEAYLNYKLKIVKGEYEPLNKKKLTFKQLFESWDKVYKPTVKESTYAVTMRYFNNHILSALGNIYIEKITVAECQKAVNEWFEEAPHTFDRFIHYASKVFKYGIDMELLTSNPMEKVIKPKLKERPQQYQEFYDKDELNKFLSCAKKCNFRYFVYFRLLAYTGMRKGESLALKWSDIDFETNTISITRNVTTGLNNRPYISNGKTANSVRRIPVDSETMNYLKEWRYCQQKDMLKKGFNFLDADNYIFPTINNGITSLSKPRQWNKSICDKFGLRRIKIHGFRHTHASLCYSAGLNAKEIQKRLGHADSKTTMNVYTHVMKNDEKKAVKKFADFMK
ncbi:tyrosine-type recombinase/integrase [Lactobacillus intestinalis]|uniref:tyrosine-type recombinase/integrase n=1 Tax=Lactobacillus intestinalis TaxID=151781 RepID=UPI0002C99828|nr:site-specific integrase [Lactobacillus intestinalis]KAI4309332.1 Tyrosine recombinase XerC [Lactobacillus intestinalis]